MTPGEGVAPRGGSAELRWSRDAAWEATIVPHLSTGYRLARGTLGDPSEAEDAVQDAAVTAWSKLLSGSGLDEDRRLWFLGIVANHCRNRLRHRWRSVLKVPFLREPALSDGMDAERLDVRRALARLPHQERLVIVLRFYLDLPVAEIAEAVGAPEGTVKSRLHRATQLLREAMATESA